jgi:Bifunctional DNA primase/polymerase, N-terminal
MHSESLAPWQDRLNPAPAALAEALRLNLPAFPCGADKRPVCPHGFKDAVADPNKLRELWERHPGPLVGVPTGDPSGIFVIDIDSGRHDEAEDWLERHSPYLPETRQHATKSGGWHLLFRHRPGLKNTAGKLAKGVDTRGEGGYIIWWPFHLGLSAPHKFDAPTAELPNWICEALNPPRIVQLPRAKFDKSVASNKVQGVLNAVAQELEGNRNGILFWAACTIRDMIANREIGDMEGARSFGALNIVAQKTGLSAREVARTIQSAVGRQ